MSFFYKFLSCRVLIAQLLVALISLPVNSATLTGTDGDDTLLGYSGDDQFTSGEGSDVLIGYGGDDTFMVDGIGDKTIDGGSGNNILEINYIGISSLADFTTNLTNSTLTLTDTNGGIISANGIVDPDYLDNTGLRINGIDYTFVDSSLSNNALGEGTMHGGSFGGTYGVAVDEQNKRIHLFQRGTSTFATYHASRVGWNSVEDQFIGRYVREWENISIAFTLYGSPVNDFVSAGGQADIISTFDGNDQVYPAGGEDFVDLGAGNDVVFVNMASLSEDSSINGGAGSDTLNFGRIFNLDGNTQSLDASVSIDISSTGNASNFENIVGTWGGNDNLTGDHNANVLIGSGGDDTLNGMAGNDMLYGDLDTNDASGEIYGLRSYNVSSSSYWGNDIISGGAGDDVLVGNGGDDILDGGSGSDVLTGGEGYDSFVINTVSGSTGINESDFITDFEDGKDIIELQGISYSDLIITQGENDYLNDVIVQHAGEYLLVIQNTQLSSINYLDFVTAEPADSDDDGVPDHLDAFPLDAAETADIDGDGIGDNSDTDADNDGLPNDYETANGLNPVDASDAQSDSDMDGLTALEEFNLGTSLTNDDTDRDTLPDGWEVENGRDPLVADYQIDVGGSHSCAIDDSGVSCWGNNSMGQIDVPELSNPKQVSVGAGYNCAIDDTGVVCWGENSNYGRINVPELDNPIIVATGNDHNCAIDDTGVVCWGNNLATQTNVPTLINPYKVDVGSMHTCALDDNGVKCWGLNTNGQTNVPSLVATKDLSLGENFSCALGENEVICWGFNSFGVTDVPELNNPIQISAGRAHVCALDDSGVVCWGHNDTGQTDVPLLANPKQILIGGDLSCALDDTGLVCWGKVVWGQDSPTLMIDLDGDGFSNQNGQDKFPYDPSEWYDTDLDGIGNNTDSDIDGDGFDNEFESSHNSNPLIADFDIDNDGIANELDPDNDNDGSLDIYDVFPLDVNEQIDSDADGVGDNADADNDNDGVINSLDLFPLDAFESADSDGDGVGDNADFFPNSAEYSLDSDLDQMPDAWERKYGLNPTDASDALLDQDNDGLTALEEYEAGTIPLKILDIDANGSFDALTDGLIILRYAFGLRGQSLIDDVISEDANRTQAADIEAYIETLLP